MNKHYFIHYYKQFKTWALIDDTTSGFNGDIVTVCRNFTEAQAQYYHLIGELFPYGGEDWPVR